MLRSRGLRIRLRNLPAAVRDDESSPPYAYRKQTMTDKTRDDLIAQALINLKVIGSGQSPDADDSAPVDGTSKQRR